MAKKKSILIGLVDADLLCKGTRHPNLVLLKIAGYLRDHDVDYELIIDEDADLENYKLVYLSRVFTFTSLPSFITDYQSRHPRSWQKKIKMGGTGFYATEEDRKAFDEAREKDMNQLSRDPFLQGFSMAHQMPDYNIYNKFIDREVENKVQEESKKFAKKEGKEPTQEEIGKITKKCRTKYKDYLDYSIGFLTRGCIRQCSFCVNKGETAILPYSRLEDFVDETRPFIYLWDDNFLCYKNWKELLQQLIDCGKPFQFRQGLDERVLTEERAEMLSKASYHGDFIFAFDQWKDRDLIERKLKIWKRHCASKTTKFYLFCGYELTADNDEKLFEDIYYLFQRIKILMSYGCLGYVMRHADYQNHPLGNIYTQIARWCNQPQFYKKMSFWEYCYRNQSFWEQKTKKLEVPDQIPFEEFEKRLQTGFYEQDGFRLCKTTQTFVDFLNKFPERRREMLEVFNYKWTELINPKLWEEKYDNRPYK